VLRIQEQSAGQLVPGLEMRCVWQCIGCLGYDVCDCVSVSSLRSCVQQATVMSPGHVTS
jgi:hypothetical protein